MTISQHKVVEFHYTVTDAKTNEVIDSSKDTEP